ncbi:MAG: amidohydrolase family protein [Betaproteobacteria bacterium]|nr:amidohydrolase family protein [Betaproteobacteria bacterium]
MSIVDSHHHLWDHGRNLYPWLRGETHDRGWGDTTLLHKNYLVADLLADGARQGLAKSVHVQANFDPSNPVGETAWLEEIAAESGSRGFPHGIVGFADFSSPEVESLLEQHSKHSRVRGMRQVLNRHPDPKLNRAPKDYLADETWQKNLGLLKRYGWTFDAQVYYQQMPALAALARRYPDMQFILDHAGMPAERDAAGIEGWRRGMQQLAGCSNIAVKLCGYGMVDNRWTVESIRPYVLKPIEWFGPQRCMFASNFPVDRLMASYDRLWDAYREITAGFSSDEKNLLLCKTAERIYQL